MNKTTILILFFLLFIPLGLAAPPFQTSDSLSDPNLLYIQYPKLDNFKVGTTVKLHFHVYNGTAALVTNSTVNCSIHVYNSTGNHIIEANMIFDSNGQEWYQQLNNTKINKTGAYAYIAYCNKSTTPIQRGWVSVPFSVTNEGITPDNLGNLVIAIMLIFVVGVLAYFSRNAQDNTMKGLFSMSSIALLIGVTNYARLVAIENNASANLVGSIWLILWVMLMIALFLALYLILQLVLVMLKKLGGIKNTED